MAFLHRRGLVNTALKRPDRQSWPLQVDRLPAATDDYYRRKAGLWQRQPGVYGHIEMPGDEHWDPGGLNYPVLFEMVSDVLNAGGDKEMGLSEEELDAVRFAKRPVVVPRGRTRAAGGRPKRRGYRFARSIKEHLEELTASAEAEPVSEALPDDAELNAMREYQGPQEYHAGREEEEQGGDAPS
jgi:hypothetical protein